MSSAQNKPQEAALPYLERYEQIKKTLAQNEPKWLTDFRASGAARLSQKGFPHPKDEAWRQTNLKPLRDSTFAHEVDATLTDAETKRIQTEFFMPSGDAYRLVFVNGQYNESLSTEMPSDFQFKTMKQAYSEHSDFIQSRLGKAAPVGETPFVAMNAALMNDGAFLHLPANVQADKPIQILYVSTERAEGAAWNTRNLFVADKGAEASVVESHIGLAENVYFSNNVTETYVDSNARLIHYRYQQESLSAFHFAAVAAEQERDSRYRNFSLAFGARMARNDIIADLGGENITCTLNGLYLGKANQHIDHHTRLEHANPNCNSYEFYKGILDEKATAVFTGRIHVHEDAQKTDAVQSNRGLLLSETAHIDSQPQLEIYADDVKCTHGATVGQMDDEAIFYLRTRGIGEAEARGLLTFAFANEIIEQIELPELRDRLEQMILKRFHQRLLSESKS